LYSQKNKKIQLTSFDEFTTNVQESLLIQSNPHEIFLKDSNKQITNESDFEEVVKLIKDGQVKANFSVKEFEEVSQSFEFIKFNNISNINKFIDNAKPIDFLVVNEEKLINEIPKDKSIDIGITILNNGSSIIPQGLSFKLDKYLSSDVFDGINAKIDYDIPAGKTYQLVFTFLVKSIGNFKAYFNLCDNETDKNLTQFIVFDLTVASYTKITDCSSLIPSTNPLVKETDKLAMYKACLGHIRESYPELIELGDTTIYSALKRNNFSIDKAVKELSE